MRAAARVLCAGSVGTALLLVLGQAAAAPGDLDPSFGTGGTVETWVGGSSTASDIALQPDGKIVLGGWSHPAGFALARYLPDGSLDAGFGSGGVATGPYGNAYALALQPDGKLLLAGWVSNGLTFALARYDSDGTLDASFGSGGIARGPEGDARAIAVQPDGKIVVAGYGPEPNPQQRYTFIVARFKTDGTLDTGFGSSGVVRTSIGSSAGAAAVTITPDAMILAAGYSESTTPPPYTTVALARYRPDGTLDPSFGSGGTVTTRIGSESARAAALALQPDGKIVAAGAADNEIAVARYSADGHLDPAFGTDGTVTTPIGSLAYAEDVALQPDGRIVVVGYAGVFALARYLPDGSLDSSFGSGGTVTNAIAWSGLAAGVAVQPDGRILAGGWASDPAGSRFALARYLTSSPTTISASPAIVPFGRAVTLTGTVAGQAPGTNVAVLRRDCYQYSATVAARVVTGTGGTWSVRARPSSRTVFQADVRGETSSPFVVQVAPRLTIVRLSARRIRAKALFGHSLAGVPVALQRYNPVAGDWFDVRQAVLRRIGRRAGGVVSAATLRIAPRSGRRLRVILRSHDSYDCYTDALSPAIRG